MNANDDELRLGGLYLPRTLVVHENNESYAIDCICASVSPMSVIVGTSDSQWVTVEDEIFAENGFFLIYVPKQTKRAWAQKTYKKHMPRRVCEVRRMQPLAQNEV